MEIKKLYRYETPLLDWSEKYELKLYEFEVQKETDKGYWIFQLGGKPGLLKFVLKFEHKGSKRFAYEEKKDALWNYICRKEKRIKILQEQMATDEKGLKVALKMFSDGN